ncbi:RNA methyltransferase [Paenibacillus nanensis]|uniref:RNA methyltransferase n=1 Tax=Paenibacillus nanensis TaxID=393251 RepID=A0A3A1UMV2_9BACL|nr:RsmD family RNA methyltransferase [Paenibacillus nanensis]RIX49418.1 RNA methyltransferase [Paenibacillus nanensis]
MEVLYTYARHEDEAELCGLELRSMLGGDGDAAIGSGTAYVVSDQPPDVNRSPFFKRRLEKRFADANLQELLERLPDILLHGRTFKVLYMQGDEPFDYREQRELERLAGARLQGKADMKKPELLFGLSKYKGQWLFGPCEENEALWLRHQHKPQNYSTALPTRAARALVNIAAGSAHPDAVRLIDPCCGMGTVIIEALSMGMRIAGIDANPLAVRGARNNLNHFGYPDVVRLGDMKDETEHYDAAIVDLPYNLCSVLLAEEALEMLRAVRRMADRAVIVATEDMESRLAEASFRIIDRAILSKGSFTRFISVVE